MKSFLLNIRHAIDQLNEWIGGRIAWLTALLVLLTVLDVVWRRLLNNTQTWIMEMEWHLFALIFLLGAGYAYKHDRHVRVDLFYARFSSRDKAWVNLIGNVLFLMPWCAVLIWFAAGFAWNAFKIREASPDPGGLPARYVIKFSIVVGAVLLMLQGIADTITAVLKLMERKKEMGG